MVVKPHPLCISRTYFAGRDLEDALNKLEVVLSGVDERIRKRNIDFAKIGTSRLIRSLEELVEWGCFPGILSEQVRNAIGLAKEAFNLIDTDPSEARRKLESVQFILDDITTTMYADYIAFRERAFKLWEKK